MSGKPNVPGVIEIEDARFVYRPNFRGEKEMYNEPGNRYFNVAIRNEDADMLAADGWNIKWTKEKPETADEYPKEAYLQVTVQFGYMPPEIVLLKGSNRTELNEMTVESLDYTDLETFDVVIRPYRWRQANGDTGIKAYLQTFYGVVPTDSIREKWANR